MSDAREKAVERLAKRFYDAILGDQFTTWTAFDDPEASASTREDAFAHARAVMSELGLVAVNPALVEAVERARAVFADARSEASVASLVEHHGTDAYNEFGPEPLAQGDVFKAERALADAVLDQLGAKP